MDLADLQLLDLIARLGSFSAAAKASHLSQPAVSARIAALEKAIGAQLFDRQTRGAQLTPSGERYLGYVRRSMRLLDDGARAAAAEPAHRPITVGAPASYAPALARLLIDAPPSPVTLRTGHSGDLSREVLDGRVDLAIVSTRLIPARVSAAPLALTRVIAVASPQHSVPDRFALHSWDTGADAILAELLSRGVPRTAITVVSPAATALELAVDGQAIAIVPDLSAAAHLDRGTLVRHSLPLPELTASISLIRAARGRDARLDALAAHIHAGWQTHS